MPVKVVLKPGRESALLRFHSWVFSGAVQRIEGQINEGDVAEVVDSRNQFLGFGHFSKSSITVRIFSFQKVAVNKTFWVNKIRNAYQRREALGLTQGSLSNAYRLIFMEGDGLPGLVIDFYNGVAVIQTHTEGMYRLIPVFNEALREIYGEKLLAVYDKSAETMHRSLSSPGGTGTRDFPEDRFVFGESGPVEIMETGHRFRVDFLHGQKTGFFLDQRSNRLFAQFYGKDRNVLNGCCYSGAFSVYSMKGGARSVVSLDSSERAIQYTEENLKINQCDMNRHRSVVADIKKYLSETEENFDMIILDPPAFAKTHSVTHNALQAYIHINARAMKHLTPGGILITFSCSQPVTREMFRSAIQAAAIETGKEVRILHQLSQGQDHPINSCHPENEYLKGLILQVD